MGGVKEGRSKEMALSRFGCASGRSLIAPQRTARATAAAARLEGILGRELLRITVRTEAEGIRAAHSAPVVGHAARDGADRAAATDARVDADEALVVGAAEVGIDLDLAARGRAAAAVALVLAEDVRVREDLRHFAVNCLLGVHTYRVEGPAWRQTVSSKSILTKDLEYRYQSRRLDEWRFSLPISKPHGGSAKSSGAGCCVWGPSGVWSRSRSRCLGEGVCDSSVSNSTRYT